MGSVRVVPGSTATTANTCTPGSSTNTSSAARPAREAQDGPSAAWGIVDNPQGPDALQGLPEAPASVNCHLTISGRQVQLTLRDSDEARLLQRLAAVLQQYPVPQPAPQAPTQARVVQQAWCADDAEPQGWPVLVVAPLREWLLVQGTLEGPRGTVHQAGAPSLSWTLHPYRVFVYPRPPLVRSSTRVPFPLIC